MSVYGGHPHKVEKHRGSRETLGAGVKTIKTEILLFSRNQPIYLLPIASYLFSWQLIHVNPFWRWKDVFITEKGDVRISREVMWGGSLKCGTLKHAVTKALQRHMRQEQKCEDLGAKGCPFSFVFGQLLAGDGIWVNPCQAAARLVSWI